MESLEFSFNPNQQQSQHQSNQQHNSSAMSHNDDSNQQSGSQHMDLLQESIDFAAHSLAPPPSSTNTTTTSAPPIINIDSQPTHPPYCSLTFNHSSYDSLVLKTSTSINHDGTRNNNNNNNNHGNNIDDDDDDDELIGDLLKLQNNKTNNNNNNDKLKKRNEPLSSMLPSSSSSSLPSSSVTNDRHKPSSSMPVLIIVDSDNNRGSDDEELEFDDEFSTQRSVNASNNQTTTTSRRKSSTGGRLKRLRTSKQSSILSSATKNDGSNNEKSNGGSGSSSGGSEGDDDDRTSRQSKRFKKTSEKCNVVNYHKDKNDNNGVSDGDDDDDGEHEIDFANSQDYREMIQEDDADYLNGDSENDNEDNVIVTAGYGLRSTPKRRRQRLSRNNSSKKKTNEQQRTPEREQNDSDNDSDVIMIDDKDDKKGKAGNKTAITMADKRIITYNKDESGTNRDDENETEQSVEISANETETKSNAEVLLMTPQKVREERKRRLDSLVASKKKSKGTPRRLVRRALSRPTEPLFESDREESSSSDEEEQEQEYHSPSTNGDSQEFSFDPEPEESTRHGKQKNNRRVDALTDSIDDFIVPDDQQLTQYDSSEYEAMCNSGDDDKDDDGESGDEQGTQYNIQFDSESQSQAPTNKYNSQTTAMHLGPRKLKDCYEVALQYYLSCILDPDFASFISNDRDESYFKPALRKVFSELETKKSSIVSSSIWTSQFMEHLHSYPQLKHMTYLGANHSNCDICRRKGHPARFKIQFYGKRLARNYYSSTLIASSSSSSSSTNEAATESDEEEGEGEAEDNAAHDTNDGAVYLAGSHCFRRVILYHVMHHYKYLVIEKLKLLAAAAETEVRRMKQLSSRAKVQETDIVNEVMRSQEISDMFHGYRNLLDILYSSGSRPHTNDPLTSYTELVSYCFPDAVPGDFLHFPHRSELTATQDDAVSVTPKKKKQSKLPRAKMNELQLFVIKDDEDNGDVDNGGGNGKNDNDKQAAPHDAKEKQTCNSSCTPPPDSPIYSPYEKSEAPPSHDGNDERPESPAYGPTLAEDDEEDEDDDLLTTKLLP